jgi:hypothetical protein
MTLACPHSHVHDRESEPSRRPLSQRSSLGPLSLSPWLGRSLRGWKGGVSGTSYSVLTLCFSQGWHNSTFFNSQWIQEEITRTLENLKDEWKWKRTYQKLSWWLLLGMSCKCKCPSELGIAWGAFIRQHMKILSGEVLMLAFWEGSRERWNIKKHW